MLQAINLLFALSDDKIKVHWGRGVFWKNASVHALEVTLRKGVSDMAFLNIPKGRSDFETIRREGFYYVDKTGLIGEILKSSGTQVTLITRPRRFGKTLGMSTLECFLDIQKDSTHKVSGTIKVFGSCSNLTHLFVVSSRQRFILVG